MGPLAIAFALSLCLSSTFATYGDHHQHLGPKNFHDGGHHLKLNHLDRPSIDLLGGARYPLHDDEPIILAHDRPLYIRKTLHGIPATPAHHLLDSGYGHGKAHLDIAAPVQVIRHAPVVHERPILIRQPVIVSSSLAHREDLHGIHSGLGHLVGLPISKGLHERTVVYGGHGHYDGHGLYGGHGHYGGHVLVEQPRAYIGHRAVAYGNSKGGLNHGGVLLHGGLHDAHALHGGIVHGGASLKKY